MIEVDQESSTVDPQQPTAWWRAVVDWVIVVGVALAVALLFRTYVVAHYEVDGASMASTLSTGDRVFVSKVSFYFSEPTHGDVIVLHQRVGDRDLIKRVVAVAGETIEVADCVVKVDGAVVDEPYLDPNIVQPGRCGESVVPTTVPDGHVYVLGDNRPGSLDSRRLGPIAVDDVVGKAFVVFWPTDHWRWL